MGNTNLQDTAVLIFANSAEVDARDKFAVSSSRLFEALTSHTLQTVKKSGLPFFHVSEKEQQGTSFGERFSNAIQAIYTKGFENVITIGNDSPHLRTFHLLAAHKQLKLGRTVLGPTPDGGFYLMGLHKSNFDAHLFQRLPWQRFGLFHKISQLFESYDSSIFKLPVLHDIDAKEDIISLLNFSKRLPKAIFNILMALVTWVIEFSERNIPNPNNYFKSLHHNKGSPQPLFSS